MIIINGKKIDAPDGSSVSVINDVVYIDGKQITETVSKQLDIQINGTMVSMTVDRGNVTINGNCGPVKASGSVSVSGDVNGTIEAGGSVNSVSVHGDVTAGGSVHCGNITGSVVAGGSVR